jgi:hypothetical protein
MMPTMTNSTAAPIAAIGAFAVAISVTTAETSIAAFADTAAIAPARTTTRFLNIFYLSGSPLDKDLMTDLKTQAVAQIIKTAPAIAPPSASDKRKGDSVARPNSDELTNAISEGVQVVFVEN